MVRRYLSPVGRAHHANQYLQHPRARHTGYYHGSELSLLCSGPPLAPVLCRYNRRPSSREEGKGPGFRCMPPALYRALPHPKALSTPQLGDGRPSV